MAIPNHRIHIYQRPKQGSAFINAFNAYNYQHTISAQGWFDTASCDVAVKSEVDGQNFLDHYLGCYVAIYVDNPVQPVWEGLINRITFNSGLASYSISLDEMANRVSVVYTTGANVGTETAAVDNTASQAIYGIKQDQIEFGGDPSAGTMRTVLQNTILAQRAYPQSSYSQAQGDANLVHLELVGIFHTLEWEKRFQALTAASGTTTARITTLIGVIANGATFFDNTNTTLITTNATTMQNQNRDAYWDIFQKAAESGDGSQYWVCGITPTNPNTGKRLFYYRVANGVINYTARQSDGLKPRSIYGQIIPPWRVVPDNAIRVVDTLVGVDPTIQTDPRALYIQNIQYDANSQSVQWFGTDDTTARAAFFLRRRFKPLNRNMPGAAPTRVIVT
jgi:hypothetical protein